MSLSMSWSWSMVEVEVVVVEARCRGRCRGFGRSSRGRRRRLGRRGLEVDVEVVVVGFGRCRRRSRCRRCHGSSRCRRRLGRRRLGLSRSTSWTSELVVAWDVVVEVDRAWRGGGRRWRRSRNLAVVVQDRRACGPVVTRVWRPVGLRIRLDDVAPPDRDSGEPNRSGVRIVP